MISLLALSVVGSWSYTGFLAEPTPAPPSATPEPKLPPASASIEPGLVDTPKPRPPAGPDLPAVNPQTKLIPRPTLFRSTDALGQTWEHADAAFLASFVEARNRSLVPFRYVSTPPFAASRCVGGRCN